MRVGTAVMPTPGYPTVEETVVPQLNDQRSGQLIHGRDLRLLPTAGNAQPALAVYTGYQPLAIKVVTVTGGCITAVTGFGYPHLFTAFGLANTHPGGVDVGQARSE